MNITVKAAETKPIMIIVDNEEIETDTPPVIINGRLLVPVRTIFNALGAEIKWDDYSRTITATKGSLNIYLKIDDKNCLLNGEKIVLDVEPQIINNHTMIPLRFIAQSFGAEVFWVPEWNRVAIVTSSFKNPLSEEEKKEEEPKAVVENQYGFSPPLILIADNKEKVFLGKLTTNEFEKDSIFNQFGEFGSKYSQKSIWNEFGPYGSKFSSYSPWNKFTSTPPLIVDKSGTVVGRLSLNNFIKGAINPYELYKILKRLGL